MVENKQEAIHDKGFNMGNGRDSITDYGKIKVGTRALVDATLDLGTLVDKTKPYTSKSEIMKALANQDLPALRKVSEHFYRTSGIYQRVCNYFATMYRFDWYIVPEVYDENVKEEKVVQEFTRILNFLDNLS